MREIKFRAWAGDRNTMYHNVGFKNHPNGFDVLVYDSYTGEENGWMYSHTHKIILMQYTGLKDKNGKEIYEGDILTDDRGKNYWYLQFGVKRCNDCGGGSGWYLNSGYIEDIIHLKIIGNIYENPELLEVK